MDNNSPSDRSEGDRKVNNNSPSDQTEGENSRSIKTNLPSQREQVGASSRKNNDSSYSMAQEGDNGNNEYFVLIQTRLGRGIFKPNHFVQVSEIAIGLLACQCNNFLQASRPGSIETIKNELANLSIF